MVRADKMLDRTDRQLLARAHRQAQRIEPLVTPDAGCPNCHERAMDRLEWDAEGVTITCLACGETYTL